MQSEMVSPSSRKIDVEIAIRTDRIVKVLDETIGKIEIALCLPEVIKNLDRFTSLLNESEFTALSKCEVYLSADEFMNSKEKIKQTRKDEEEAEMNSFINHSIKESQSSTSETGVQHFEMEYEKLTTTAYENPTVKRAIYILWKRPDLAYAIKTEYLQFSQENPAFIFLENMKALKRCVYTRLMEDLSPVAEGERNQFYKDVWKRNEEAVAKINTLKPMLDDVMARVQEELQGKSKLISDMYNRIANFQAQFKGEIEKICSDSEKNMALESKTSEARQEIIQKDIESFDKTVQNTLDGHLKREKELRVKRYKIESQLEACLETYDNEMGERQAEFEELLAEYEEEKQQMATLQEKFDEQEKEYIVLMEEKAYEEHLELERRIEDLRRRVAARTIQTHWRNLKQRRLERAKSKKAKKGKGKKKGGEKPKSPKKPGSPGKKGGSPKKLGSASKKP